MWRLDGMQKLGGRYREFAVPDLGCGSGRASGPEGRSLPVAKCYSRQCRELDLLGDDGNVNKGIVMEQSY